jgi:hypothetical protein
MTTFRVAFYDSDGSLVKTYVGEPLWLQPTAQQTADMVARSADEGCTYPAGVVAVWNDPDLEPAAHADDSPRPDAARAFGAHHPRVPTYRWDRSGAWDVLLIPDDVAAD